MSAPDAETLAVYDARAEAYADMVADLGIEPMLDGFLDALPSGGRILDLGAGPGHAAAAMAARGFQTDAWDPSPAMVALAKTRYGIAARKAGFADLKALDRYDGIWANFSLLHAPRALVPRHLKAIQSALKKAGVLHLAVKEGSGEGRDPLGRFYTYFTDAQLTDQLGKAGFTILARQRGEGAGLAGEVAPWISVLARA